MSNNLVITIMAAGEGKRMNSNIPKVLHNFKNIPMLVRIINESLKLNPSKIIIITGKYDELIKLNLALHIDSNIFNNLYFIKQLQPNGTGDAIKTALPHYENNDNVLILNGDMPLIKSSLLINFINSKSNLLIAKLDNPFGYGRIIEENNTFNAIREEKDCSELEKEINNVNVGIYNFSGYILKKYIPLIKDNNVQKEYYLTDIIEIIKFNENLNIKTYLINENDKYMIMGVNTKKELDDLEKLFSE